MATAASPLAAESVEQAIRRQKRKRTGSPMKPNEFHLLKGTITMQVATVAASFTGANDEFEILEFPPNTYLVGYSIDVPVLDEHATPTIVLDVEVDNGTTTYVLNDGSATSSTVGQTAGTIEMALNGMGGSAEFILDSDAYDAGYLLDVSGYTLQLACTTAAATDITSDATLNYKVLVYHGDVADLGTVVI